MTVNEAVDIPTPDLPANVTLGRDVVLRGQRSFQRFRSTCDPAITIDDECFLDHVHFALGPQATLSIGSRCYLSSVLLLCEAKITIGDRVLMGWNVTLTDTDFHPLDPALRRADAIACSPLSDGRPRPTIEAAEVVIGSDVWIGPSSTIMKGVTIGEGCYIEPGSVLTRDMPPMSRIMGNPARVVGEVRRDG